MSTSPLRLSFVVPGPPVPTARPLFVVRKFGEKAVPVAITRKATRAYQAHVGLFAQGAVSRHPSWGAFVQANPLGRLYRVHLHFVLETNRGDLDNFAKSLTDGMNTIAWADDRQVAQMLLSLSHEPKGEHRAEVLVELAGARLTEPLWSRIAIENGWRPTKVPASLQGAMDGVLASLTDRRPAPTARLDITSLPEGERTVEGDMLIRAILGSSNDAGG